MDDSLTKSRSVRDFLANKKETAADKLEELTENYPDGAGRSAAKYPTFGVYLMWPGQKTGYTTRGIPYGFIDEEICYDNPGDGKLESITFGYSTGTKSFKVTITGRELTPIYDAMMESKRKIIRISKEKDDRPFVQQILVVEIKEEEDEPNGRGQVE